MARLPSPTTPDPMDAPPLRWGVLAPGGIASTFVAALQAGTRQQVVACGSRSLERAREFASRFGGFTAYGSYDELVADPEVDVVYVASPHSGHHDLALSALRAGKPVLVEKAFARNAAEAREIIDEARARKLFCMEAMWSRFLPRYDVVRQAVADGLIGTLQTIVADHGQLLYPNGPQRLTDPALAGGALLDLGIYPISLAAMFMPGELSVSASGLLTPEGVDASEVVALTGGDVLASCVSTMTGQTANTAVIAGDSARLELDGWFYQPGPVRLVAHGDTVLDTYVPASAEHGLHFEAAEVARRITAGETQSPLMPWDETLRIMQIMDEVRAQLGVRFPGEPS
ncbi:Gfo/Idh/MocA family oxidoreductase [Flexivirga sp. ID2601S]|uniref:Gfo/Idh/MocA family oxidoreductase n=1 Tax=Flexivirga aerilata TaxID=1656889 RepID=A0A849AWF5_9MICO|nr:Gfo/Idh/MocA family oxidoreductase [Flexivirga aerilata]NNG41002.1 Gfo/Idh/MocA family oxidoreductase [Flexivirga aerilata]